VHGLRASEFKSAYTTAKHGVMGLTKTTALEGGPHGITVNAICPAYVRTPLVDNQIDAQAATHGIPS
jgi:3-hydroxybutyrate dehydrogenase